MSESRASERASERKPEQRKERVPVSAGRSPLKYNFPDTDKYVYRWVLDKEDRIRAYLEGGYEFYEPKDLKPVGDASINRQSQDGSSRLRRSAAYGGLYLYAMRIPIEWYKEDQKFKQIEVDETEAMMRPDSRQNRDGVEYGSMKLNRSTRSTDLE